MLPSSKMCSVPGRPRAAPVMTTGLAGRVRLLAVINLPAALEHIGEHAAKFGVAIAVRRRCGGRDAGSRCCGSCCCARDVGMPATAWLRRRCFGVVETSAAASALPAAQSRRIQAAQRLVEGRNIADFGMIGEQRNHVAASLPSTSSANPCNAFFGPTSTKTRAPASYSVCRPFTNCTGRGDLLREQVQHLRNNVGPGGIKLAVHVGDDRHLRRLQMQARQHLPQRLAGRSHNRGVESVADRQRHDVVAGLQEDLHGLLDRFAGAADDRLVSLLTLAITT